MELSTFGNILRFTLERELELKTLAEEGQRLGFSDDRNELLASMAAAFAKTIKQTERARQENISEVVLEPIQGLNTDDFANPRPQTLTAANFGPFLTASLGTALRFYNTAAAKLTMHDFRSVFTRIAKERDALLANSTGVFQ